MMTSRHPSWMALACPLDLQRTGRGVRTRQTSSSEANRFLWVCICKDGKLGNKELSCLAGEPGFGWGFFVGEGRNLLMPNTRVSGEFWCLVRVCCNAPGYLASKTRGRFLCCPARHKSSAPHARWCLCGETTGSVEKEKRGQPGGLGSFRGSLGFLTHYGRWHWGKGSCLEKLFTSKRDNAGQARGEWQVCVKYCRNEGRLLCIFFLLGWGVCCTPKPTGLLKGWRCSGLLFWC